MSMSAATEQIMFNEMMRVRKSGKYSPHESNYTRLFGTPERAARYMYENSTFIRCADCPICHDEHGETCEIPGDSCVWVNEEGAYDALLEWLKQEVDA